MDKICKNCRYKFGDDCRHPHGLRVIVDECYCCYFSETSGNNLKKNDVLKNDYPDAQIPFKPIDLV